MSIIIRQAKWADVAALDECMPTSGGHVVRIEAQSSGSISYLVALECSTNAPIGHLMIRWDGSVHAAAWTPAQPEIGRMAVAENMRGRGVARMLLRIAEGQVLRAGCSAVGLAVGVENHSAKRLYERAGFVSTSIEPFVSSYGMDAHGRPCDHTVQYMVKSLVLLHESVELSGNAR